MLGAAAEWYSDDTAGEGHEQGMMLLIQLHSQNPPVLLPLNVAPVAKHGHVTRENPYSTAILMD